MTRILLRAPKSPFEVASPEEVLSGNLIGLNAGNLVFLHAAWKILSTPGTTITPDGLRTDPAAADAINEQFDVYVIPLANAFRRSFRPHLARLTRLIERLRIPVVVLGVGAQSGLGYSLERLEPMDDATRQFVRAVLDRSGRIGVRGEFTERYLNHLGFRDVDVIGCPSMFLWGPDLQVEKRVPTLTANSPIGLTLSPYLHQMGPFVEAHTRVYPRLTYFPQDLATLRLLLHGGPPISGAPPDIPLHVGHQLFAEDRVRFHVEPWTWIDDLRHQDFVIGTRIHGTITALLAGTPAYLIAHDSRTLELARYFDIPFKRIRRLKPRHEAAFLYAKADFTALNAGHVERFDRFLRFLDHHGLEDTFRHGDGGAAFEARVAATKFPAAVGFNPQTVERRWRRRILDRLRSGT